MATAQRKSRSVPLGITAALAGTLLTVYVMSDPEYDAVCVAPGSQVRLDDDYCDDNDHDGHSGGRWYYVSSGGRYPAIGGKATGGSFTAPSDAATIRKGGQSPSGGSVKGSSVSRGGFGGKSGGFGG